MYNTFKGNTMCNNLFLEEMQACDLTNVQNPEKWIAGLGPPIGLEDKPPDV